MTASRSDIGHLKVAVGVLVLGLAGCDTDRTSRFGLATTPTAPTIGGAPPAPPSPAPAPPPPSHPLPPLPTRFGPREFTPIEIGAVVRGPLVMPPECDGVPGWPCRHFQMTPAASGTLRVVLTYDSGMQGGQRVDVSVSVLETAFGVDAQFSSTTETRVEAPVVAGRPYRITMWYAFDGLEFELTTSLH